MLPEVYLVLLKDTKSPKKETFNGLDAKQASLFIMSDVIPGCFYGPI